MSSNASAMHRFSAFKEREDDKERRVVCIPLDPRNLIALLYGRMRITDQFPPDTKVLYTYCDPSRRHAWMVVLESEEFELVAPFDEIPMSDGGWQLLFENEDGSTEWVGQ